MVECAKGLTSIQSRYLVAHMLSDFFFSRILLIGLQLSAISLTIFFSCCNPSSFLPQFYASLLFFFFFFFFFFFCPNASCDAQMHMGGGGGVRRGKTNSGIGKVSIIILFLSFFLFS